MQGRDAEGSWGNIHPVSSVVRRNKQLEIREHTDSYAVANVLNGWPMPWRSQTGRPSPNKVSWRRSMRMYLQSRHGKCRLLCFTSMTTKEHSSRSTEQLGRWVVYWRSSSLFVWLAKWAHKCCSRAVGMGAGRGRDRNTHTHREK